MSVGDEDPFLIHNASKAGRAETHVLVIGVGEYPYLPGGAEFDPETGYEDLGQLASPPQTARDIAKWFCDNYRNSSAPLGTVSLLVSEPGAAASSRATIANVCAAIKGWKRRSEGDPKSFPIFYFCGHGLASGELLALLAEDFAADTDSRLSGALDFVRFHQGMARLKSERQLFFVDACRTNARLVVHAGGYAGRVPIEPDATVGWGLRPVFYSTLKGLPAYGRTRSHFGEALLAALNGAGSDNDEDQEQWRVTTARMLAAIQALMKRRVDDGLADAQIPASDSLADFTVHELVGAPTVPVFVCCEPSLAHTEATLHYSNASQRQTGPAADPSKGWSLELQCGPYDIEATFNPSSDYRAARLPIAYVHPPTRSFRLKVTP
jgi:hypothetical protein